MEAVIKDIIERTGDIPYGEMYNACDEILKTLGTKGTDGHRRFDADNVRMYRSANGDNAISVWIYGEYMPFTLVFRGDLFGSDNRINQLREVFHRGYWVLEVLEKARIAASLRLNDGKNAKLESEMCRMLAFAPIDDEAQFYHRAVRPEHSEVA